MASIIIFGIIALIAVVFLLSFNVKTISKTEKVQQADAGRELPEKAPDKRLSDSQQEWSEKQKLSEEKKPTNQLLRMSDDQYRKALRQMEAGPGKNSAETSPKGLNDAAYRNAARTNYKNREN